MEGQTAPRYDHVVGIFSAGMHELAGANALLSSALELSLGPPPLSLALELSPGAQPWSSGVELGSGSQPWSSALELSPAALLGAPP